MGSFTMEVTSKAVACLADPEATGMMKVTVAHDGPADYRFVSPIMVEIDRGGFTDSFMEEATPEAAGKIAKALSEDWAVSGQAAQLVHEDMQSSDAYWRGFWRAA